MPPVSEFLSKVSCSRLVNSRRGAFGLRVIGLFYRLRPRLRGSSLFGDKTPTFYVAELEARDLFVTVECD